MWRVGSLVRSQQRHIPRRLLMASRSDGEVAFDCMPASRFFSSRAGGNLGDPSEALELAAEKKRSMSTSAPEMEFFNQLADFDDDDGDDDEQARSDEEYRRKQAEIQRELDTRTGRPWTDPWEITEEQWMSTTTLDDLPDWSPEYVSRISQERVKVHPDGVPTLSVLASMTFPPPASPHPGMGEAKAYAKYRKQSHYRYVAGKAKEAAKTRVENIMALPSWDDKQDAVDELFETVQEELKKQEEILGMHPDFGSWVERALEEYLQSIKSGTEKDTDGNGTGEEDEEAQPIFMDCFSPNEPNEMVPSILSPLKRHVKDGPGRMVEEWELSAHKKTKRILLRQCTQSIAKTLQENESPRIYIRGRQGAGKSAVLASVVASARRSGYIVLYLPDGDRLRKNGFFVTPNAQRKGMFDLQDLSQEICENLLASHKDDLSGMEADKETMERYFKESQLKRVTNYSGDSMSLVDLLTYAQERKLHAPMCYSIVVDRLMNQDEKPFLMAMDEFNCYYDRGSYFHMAYDENVRNPIPMEKINLFEHVLGAMALSTGDNDDVLAIPKTMKRGGVIVAISESRAVPRKATDDVTASAERQTESEDPSQKLHIVEVPRFSEIEVDHVLANYEATGVGKLRLDRGDTIMDENEVAYLKMVSGRVGQQLLDAAVL